MLNLLPRPTSIKKTQARSAAGIRRVSYRDTLRSINWRLIAFCVALWWFVYSAPTEGVFSSHFWSGSTTTNADDF
jgi:hypothetical protein